MRVYIDTILSPVFQQHKVCGGLSATTSTYIVRDKLASAPPLREPETFSIRIIFWRFPSSASGARAPEAVQYSSTEQYIILLVRLIFMKVCIV